MRYETIKQQNIEELTEYHFEKVVIIGNSSGYETVIGYDAYNKDKDRYVSEGSVGGQMQMLDGGGNNIGLGKLSTTIRVKGLEILNENRNSEDNRANFAKFYLSHLKKYGFLADSKDDFLQTFALLFVEGCNSLKEIEPLDELLADKRLYNTRMKGVRDYIDNNIHAELNPDIKRMDLGKDENGKHVYVNTTLKGLDTDTRIETTINFDTEDVELIEILTDDNKLFTYGRESKLSHRMQWFIDNAERVLTKNQFEKFSLLRDIYVPRTDTSVKTDTKEKRKAMLETAGMTNEHLNSFMKSVSKRVNKKYEEEFGERANSLGFNYEYRKEIKEMFETFIKLVDDIEIYDIDEDDFETDIRELRQIRVTGHVAENYDKYEDFELVITKGLNLDQKKEIVRSVIGKQLLSNKLIRVIRDNIKKHLEVINNSEVKPAKQTTDNYDEYSFKGLKEMVIEDQKKDRDKQTKVFTIDTSGVIEGKKEIKDNSNGFYDTPEMIRVRNMSKDMYVIMLSDGSLLKDNMENKRDRFNTPIDDTTIFVNSLDVENRAKELNGDVMKYKFIDYGVKEFKFDKKEEKDNQSIA